MEECSTTYRSYGIPRLITALKDGRSVRIDEVPNGYDCGCVCPKCKEPLNARNCGDKRQWHFAHIENKDCKAAAVEAAIHLLAKEVLAECKSLCMPKQWDYDREYYEFDKVIIEESDNQTGYRPDCVCCYEGKQMWVEFKNTHAVGHDKAKKIRAERIDCVEIDLKECIQDKVNIREFLCNSSKNREWIYYDAYEKFRQAESDRRDREFLVRHEAYKKDHPSSKKFAKDEPIFSRGGAKFDSFSVSIRMNGVLDRIKSYFDSSREFYFSFCREGVCSKFGFCEYIDETRCKWKRLRRINIKDAANGGYTKCAKSPEYPYPLVLSNGNHHEDIAICENQIPGGYDRYSKRIYLRLNSVNDLQKFDKPELIDMYNASFEKGFDRKVTLPPKEFNCSIDERDLFLSFE